MSSQIRLQQQPAPAAPATGCTSLYAGSDGNLYQITPDGTVVKLTPLNAAGEVLIGTKAKLVPTANGFKIQVSTDGATWQDGPTYTAN